MDSYLVIPMLACVVATVVATQTWLREPDNRQLWPLAGISALAAGWAFFEVLWNQADDMATALFWARASALATAPLGPMALHALAVSGDQNSARLQRRLVWLYAATGVFIAFGLSTDWLVSGMVETWWGWSPVMGPLFALQYASIVGCVAVGLAIFRGDRDLADVELAPLVLVSVAIPVLLATLTDVILPSLGIHSVPRVGAASLAFVLAMQNYVSYRNADGQLLPEGVTGAVLRALPDGVVSLTPDGLIRSANDRFAELISTPADRIVGGTIDTYLPGLAIADAQNLRDSERRLIDASGREVEVSVSASVRELGGRISGLVLVVRDLREVSALRERLVLTGRMAAVGELAAGIAHELNSPLAYLRSNLAALRENTERFEKAARGASRQEDLRDLVSDCEEIFDESFEGIDRATAIVRDVREFSHIGHGGFAPTDISDVIKQSVRVARLQIHESIRLAVDVPEIPKIAGNGRRLMQVIVNLLVNAGHAIEHDGCISVAAEATDDEVTVHIRDDGCGIAEEDRERIFDPFFTTKPVGVGTGLGLSIAFGIVREHGGSIDVTTAAGEGSEFSIRLPQSQTPC